MGRGWCLAPWLGLRDPGLPPDESPATRPSSVLAASEAPPFPHCGPHLNPLPLLPGPGTPAILGSSPLTLLLSPWPGARLLPLSFNLADKRTFQNRNLPLSFPCPEPAMAPQCPQEKVTCKALHTHPNSLRDPLSFLLGPSDSYSVSLSPAHSCCLLLCFTVCPTSPPPGSPPRLPHRIPPFQPLSPRWSLSGDGSM